MGRSKGQKNSNDPILKIFTTTRDKKREQISYTEDKLNRLRKELTELNSEIEKRNKRGK